MAQYVSPWAKGGDSLYNAIPGTPSSSIFVYKNSLRKLKLPDKSCPEDHLFLNLPRDHNEGYNVPPQLFPPVEENLNHRRVFVAILQSKISHKH